MAEHRCRREGRRPLGSPEDSMMTLFMSITGGINWLDAYAPLREVSPIALGLMNLYIVIGFFTPLSTHGLGG